MEGCKPLSELHLQYVCPYQFPRLAAIDDEVFSVYDSVFELFTYMPERWEVSEFEKFFHKNRENYGFVASYADDIDNFLAYILYSQSKTEIEIVKLVVRSDYQRKGIGSKLLWKVLGKLSQARRVMHCTVNEHLLPFLFFMKKNYIKAVEVLPLYYTNPPSDGIKFKVEIPKNQLSTGKKAI